MLSEINPHSNEIIDENGYTWTFKPHFYAPFRGKVQMNLDDSGYEGGYPADGFSEAVRIVHDAVGLDQVIVNAYFGN